MKAAIEETVGVLLAGGLARRMGGGDKCLIELTGKPLLAHAIERLAPQCRALVINANGDAGRFDRFGLPVESDSIEGFAGPLAGVLAGLDWTIAHEPEARFVVSVATDTPFFPHDLVARMLAAIVEEEADLACAVSGERAHPVFGLWPVRLASSLRTALVEEEMRKIDRWTARFKLAQVPFASEPFDPFFNINRPEDLDKARHLVPR